MATQPLDVLDLKNIAKPVSLDGDEARWSEWRFPFENWAALLGIEEYMQESVVVDVVPDLKDLGANAQRVSKTSYAALCLHVKGRGLTRIRLEERFNGFRCWKALVQMSR